jgi:hypothetical protein
MKKLIFVLFALTILFILIKNLPLNKNTPSVIINNKTFSVDIAKTDEQRSKGLSVYDKLPLEKGMIFIFDTKGYYAFWMKDMKFPIDIIYVRENKIVDIFKNVPPPKSQNETLPIIKSKEDADAVLEINAGLCQKYNFKIGDFVKINL